MTPNRPQRAELLVIQAAIAASTGPFVTEINAIQAKKGQISATYDRF
jgi:uncharacterized protein (DUF2141 family)